MWQYCDTMFPSNKNSTFYLTPWGLHASMVLPFELRAKGVVIWVDAEDVHKLPELERLVTEETEPLARELLDSIAACALQQCQGHGRHLPNAAAASTATAVATPSWVPEVIQ